jgi:hypothetical protein
MLSIVGVLSIEASVCKQHAASGVWLRGVLPKPIAVQSPVERRTARHSEHRRETVRRGSEEKNTHGRAVPERGL